MKNKHLQILRKVSVIFIATILTGCFSIKVEMITEAVSLASTNSTLHIVHLDRHNTGGFSALSFASDCSKFITLSDYSQVNDSILDQEVRRSGWYQADVIFNKNGTLKKLKFILKGQLRDTDGSIMQGAAESMVKEQNGYLVSFDDRGTIYRYSASKKLPNALDNIPTIAYQQSNLGDGNLGLESIVLLDNGDLLALWETKKDNSISLGRLLKRNGGSYNIQYMARASPGGATKLLNGNLLILEKRWLGKKGQRMRLVEIDKDELLSIVRNENQPFVKGKVLLDNIEIDYDNNEGISSCTRNQKEWIYVMTDDNGDWPRRGVEDRGKTRQRTLLMQYNLEDLKKSHDKISK